MSIKQPSLARRMMTGAVLSAVLAAAGCSAVERAPKSGTKARAGGTLVVAQSSDVNPASFLSSALGNIVLQDSVFETLSRIDTTTGKPHGVLAKSWDMAPDMKSMDIRLREDVTFHSGRPMTSSDVVYSIQQVLDPENSARTRPIAGEISRLEPQGDHGLKLTFKRPLPNIFDVFEVMPIVDKGTFEDYRAGKEVIGTGRFTWKSWTPGGKILLEKYAGHRDAGATRLDKIEIQVITDPTALLVALQSGRVHYAVGLSPLDAAGLADQPGYAVVESGGSSLSLAFDVTKPPFDDKRVRQAVHYAIDRERIVKQVEGGLATATALPWKASTPGYDRTQGGHYTYDPPRAERIIAETGAKGTSFTVVVPDIPESIAIFTIVQNNLAAVGLDAKPSTISVTDYDERIAKRNARAPAVLMRNGTGFSPASALVTRAELIPDGNMSRFESPEYTDLVAAVTEAVTPDTQKQSLTDFNAYFLDQAFQLSLVTRPTLTVRTDDFVGVVPTDQGFLDVSRSYLTGG
ncbi:ABC transporter substrate-binding protein [Nonomuraea sp. NPDC050643]|uniref:ABC transporter substrate-binding protein n=1 Tax=Nonomuraea sp. NPDC050643 TaxID=3155660 RepID=UPI0033F5577E